MDDVKRTLREGENKAKEALRNADGEESLADKAGNLGDDIRHGLGNAGDNLGNAADDLGNELDRRTDDRPGDRRI